MQRLHYSVRPLLHNGGYVRHQNYSSGLPHLLKVISI